MEQPRWTVRRALLPVKRFVEHRYRVLFSQDTGVAMNVQRLLALLALLVCAAPAWSQGNEVPAQPDKARTGIVWGVMDAVDLSAARLRTSRPAISFEAEYIQRNRADNAAAMERMRARMAERMAHEQQPVAQNTAQNDHP
jgi:hypothetical protein